MTLGGSSSHNAAMTIEEPASEHALWASRAYGAAADHYRRDALSFWDRFGAATVSRLPLAPGGTVLDLCCGAGASALPAGRSVGPAGRVLGVGELRAAGITSLRTDVVFGTARRPG